MTYSEVRVCLPKDHLQRLNLGLERGYPLLLCLQPNG